MNWDDHIMLWNYASIKVLDIRHTIMRQGEEVRSYRLPASGFLYTTRGGARVLLDGIENETKPFHLLHGGKGVCLDILLTEEEFAFYLILYKANIPVPCRQDVLDLMERNNPFDIHYSLALPYSTSLFRKIEMMAQEWRRSNTLERFHVKTLFYQFIYELYRQLQAHGINPVKPDLVAQAIRYIHEYYAEPITLDSLAENLNYSAKNLSKVFKAQTGNSPIEYVIQVRISKAKELLIHTDATIQEIGESIGYSDRFYFTRIFKKYSGFSPVRFKKMMKETNSKEHCPYRWSRSSMAPRRIWRYIDNDYHIRYKEGNTSMYRGSKLSMMATLLFCFTLLMSACSMPYKQEVTTANKSETKNQTRMVSTINGTIEIPAQPKRVVVDLYIGSFIALDVKPIGTPELNLKNPYFTEALVGVENIGEYERISLEKVTELEPDLIVTGNEEAYQQFSKIAPTIVVPFGELENAHEEVTYFGKVLGKEAEAKAWLAEYDQRIAAAKAKVEKAIPREATFSVMQDWEKSTGVFGDNFGRGGQAVYLALGRKPPAKYAEKIMKEQIVEVSEEVLSDFSGDYIILTTNTRTLEDLKTDSIWKNLSAVKNDRVYIWKRDKSWYFDPIATLSQTEELAEWLTGEKKA